MMRKFLSTCLFVALCNIAFSQTVSLTADEIKALKSEITVKDDAKKIYHQFEKATAVYLGDVPNAIDTIRTEGLLRGNPIKVKTQQSLGDMYKMFSLALQYRLTNEKKYLDKTVEFLLAWAAKNKPNGNPIDDTNLDKAVEAYDLVKDEVPNESKKQIQKWLNETALAEINSKRMRNGRATAVNNWNAHRIKVVAEIGYALGNKELINCTIENLKSHISINLNADGTSLDFKERDAMHYHIYDLDPMLKAAIMIERAGGPNFYTYESPKGSSIKKSVDWLVPYVNGKKQHEEYVNTTVKFDRDRAKNNEPGFAPGTMFEPKLALPVFELSVYFDESQKTILQNLRKAENMQTLIHSIKRLKK